MIMGSARTGLGRPRPGKRGGYGPHPGEAGAVAFGRSNRGAAGPRGVAPVVPQPDQVVAFATGTRPPHRSEVESRVQVLHTRQIGRTTVVTPPRYGAPDEAGPRRQPERDH